MAGSMAYPRIFCINRLISLTFWHFSAILLGYFIRLSACCMAKIVLKKLFAATLLSLVLVPAQFVQAAMPLINPTEALIDNVANAESIDVSVDIDVETDNADLDQPAKLHFDLEVASDFESNTALGLSFWSTDEYGVYQAGTGSLLANAETLYFTGTNGIWYFLETETVVETPTESEVAQDTESFKDFTEDMFNEGVITYELEGLEFVNGKMAVRYAYEIDNDKLITYLVENDAISEADSDEMRTYVDQVVIDGYFWADTLSMLPVMLTVNVVAAPNETSVTTVTTSIVFNSFNEPIEIEVPANAIDFEDYVMGDMETTLMSSLEQTMASVDADGDGLTDGDENTVWYSNPFSNDSDADGYLDRTEVINGYDPNGPGKLDSDLDGLTDYNEMTIHWSDRFDADTDNDGYPDGLEIANGYSPNGPGRW